MHLTAFYRQARPFCKSLVESGWELLDLWTATYYAPMNTLYRYIVLMLPYNNDMLNPSFIYRNPRYVFGPSKEVLVIERGTAGPSVCRLCRSCQSFTTLAHSQL